MAPKKFRRSMDLFDQLPIEIIQTILRYLSTKEAARTSILSKRFLQACSTIPDINFVDVVFSKLLDIEDFDADGINKNQGVEKTGERFVMYVHHTLTRYQQHNIHIRRLFLETVIIDDRMVNILEQCLRKAKEHRVKEVGLSMQFVRVCNASTHLLQAIFALKDQLRVLELYGCDLVKGIVQDDGIINFPSLQILKLRKVRIDQGLLRELIRCCPLIEEMEISCCEGPETIQVTNLPNLKRLQVWTVKNQMVNIESTQNLKTLYLFCNIMDQQFQDLRAKLPVLERLTLDGCDELQKINVSSRSLCSLCLINCKRLTEVKIDAPNLKKLEYVGLSVPSSSFASEGSGRKVSLCLERPNEASSFQGSSEILMKLRGSRNRINNISIYYYIRSTEISFDQDAIDNLKGRITELEELSLSVHSPSSSTYPTLMERLLLTFSPKILSVSCD